MAAVLVSNGFSQAAREADLQGDSAGISKEFFIQDLYHSRWPHSLSGHVELFQLSSRKRRVNCGCRWLEAIHNKPMC